MAYSSEQQPNYTPDQNGLDKQKDGFEMLEEEWKDEVSELTPTAINDRIAECAKLIVQKQFYLKNDPEIQKAKKLVKDLTKEAREGIKTSEKRVESLENILQDKTEIANFDPKQFDDRIAEYAKTVVQNQHFLKNNMEVLAAKEALKNLTGDAREDIKLAKKRIEFMDRVLQDQHK
jgi:HEPN domain-containing protein